MQCAFKVILELTGNNIGTGSSDGMLMVAQYIREALLSPSYKTMISNEEVSKRVERVIVAYNNP